MEKFITYLKQPMSLSRGEIIGIYLGLSVAFGTLSTLVGGK